MLQQYYNEICMGFWADPDPSTCGCRGSGWYCSDLDTWHECSYHYKGQPHPEDWYCDEESTETAEPTEPLVSDVIRGMHSFGNMTQAEAEKNDIPF